MSGRLRPARRLICVYKTHLLPCEWHSKELRHFLSSITWANIVLVFTFSVRAGCSESGELSIIRNLATCSFLFFSNFHMLTLTVQLTIVIPARSNLQRMIIGGKLATPGVLSLPPRGSSSFGRASGINGHVPMEWKPCVSVTSERIAFEVSSEIRVCFHCFDLGRQSDKGRICVNGRLGAATLTLLTLLALLQKCMSRAGELLH